MAISININDAAEMTEREITAMLAFMRTLGGECEQAREDEPQVKASTPVPVNIVRVTEPEAPVLVAVAVEEEEEEEEETVDASDYVVTTATPAPVPDLASVFAPLPPAPAIERDTAGLPWDARIHAASKATIADGTWRMRRNVDEAEVNRVEAELRAVLNGVIVAVPVLPVPVVPAPVAPVSPVTVSAPAPTAPVPPVTVSAPAPTAPGAAVLDWKVFLNSMTKHIAEKRIDTKQIGEICKSLGLRHPGDLQIRPDQFPAFKVAAEAIIGMPI